MWRGIVLTVLAAVALCAPVARAATTEGGVSSENVEWIEYHADTLGTAEGGKLVGRTFFMTNNQQGLFAFDVSEPEHPKQVGSLLLPHGAENEDVATNGRILLLSQLGDVYHLTDGTSQQGHWLNVIDVRDPANMKVIARVDGAGDHTWDCVLDCTWAYSASGHILDLRDPTQPKLLPNRWREAVSTDISPGFAHDLTEVAPGMVMAASSPMFLMDAGDPAHPRKIAAAPEDSSNAGHNVVWPRQMADRLMVTASEGSHPGRCEMYGSAHLAIWDTTGWETSHTWKPLGEYVPVNGTYTDGEPPVSATWYGCSAHWAETHPYWYDGGLVAGAFYSHGVKLLDVGADGQPKEIGYFLAHAAGASAVYWITDRVLYVADDTRGLDVIKYTGPLADRRPVEPPDVRPAGPATPLRDLVAPRLRVRAVRARRGRVVVTVRCNEDCYGRLGGRAFALRAGATKRFVLRGARRRVRVAVVDRAGNKAVVRARVRR
jgi:hypothetical protein